MEKVSSRRTKTTFTTTTPQDISPSTVIVEGVHGDEVHGMEFTNNSILSCLRK